MRVIADHIRAISFSIADGQLPSNTGAGYVIRRILRRAVRYGYQSLGIKEPFLHRMVHVLANQMGHAFPELNAQKQLIEKVIKEEEQSFYRTLENGLKRIDQVCIDLNAKKQKTIPGDVVFELYDTFGFPLDLTQLIAKGYELQIDEQGFRKNLELQKNRSRKAGNIETDDWIIISDDDVEEFVGYDFTKATINLVKYRKVKIKNKEQYQLVFNLTPFYPEGGGQVGDTGYIEAEGERIYITDTKKENNLIIHFSDAIPTNPQATFNAVVNHHKRIYTARNHTATHLLHESLRAVLGTHVEQKGSLVDENYLRFDFSHFSKVSEEELKAIENMVNEKIRANILLEEYRNLPIEKGKEMGAMALFGEKYGDTVRVIKFGTSIEFCGGTHVKNTAEIGRFKIISESAVAAGIRRIEAITSDKADSYYQEKEFLIKEINDLLKNPKDIKKAINDIITENSQLKKQIEILSREKVKNIKQEVIKEIKPLNGINFLARKLDLDAQQIKDLAFQLKNEMPNLFLVFVSEQAGKANIGVLISEEIVKDKNLHAGNIVKELAKEINGGGGGQAFYASAGGTNPQGLEQVLLKAENIFKTIFTKN
jgi:alanyl-tRNA synthetase